VELWHVSRHELVLDIMFFTHTIKHEERRVFIGNRYNSETGRQLVPLVMTPELAALVGTDFTDDNAITAIKLDGGPEGSLGVAFIA